MSGWVVRPYVDADWEGYAAVRSAVYRGGKPIAPGEKLYPDNSSSYVIEESGRIVGQAIALHMTCSIPGHNDLACAGVASVGVLPEARRGGVGIALMRGILAPLREKGFTIASLYPYREAFYRKAGYATCGWRILLKAPPNVIPHLDDTLPMREVSCDDFEVLRTCEDAFCRRYAGYNRRNATQWKRAFRGTAPKIYAVGDPIEGYFVVELVEGFWETQDVQDFVWRTGRGYRSLLAGLRALTMNQDFAEWYEPPDSPFVHTYLDRGATGTLARPIMYRVLDVPAALRHLTGMGEGEFSLRVHDRELPSNDGPWTVRFGHEGTQVQRALISDLEVSIQGLTQLVLGQPSFLTLAAAGIVQVGDERGAEAAARFFLPRTVYCLDEF